MNVIYRLTLSEGIHRRIFHLLLLMTGGFLLFYGYGLHLVYRDEGETIQTGINTSLIHDLSFFFTIGLFFLPAFSPASWPSSLRSAASRGKLKAA